MAIGTIFARVHRMTTPLFTLHGSEMSRGSQSATWPESAEVDWPCRRC